MTDRFDRDRDVLVFCRAPKTGSTSLSAMIESALGPERTAVLPDLHVDSFDHGLDRTLDQLSRAAKLRLSALALRVTGRDPQSDALFLHGHHPAWAPIRSPRRRRDVTVVREPVDRFLSRLFFLRAKAERSPASRRGSKRRMLSMEPDDFALHAIKTLPPARLNGQCLYVARSGTAEDALAAVAAGQIRAGALERLDRFNADLADYLGVPAPEMRRDNIGSRRPPDAALGPKAEARLRAALDDDRRLHAAVLSAAEAPAPL